MRRFFLLLAILYVPLAFSLTIDNKENLDKKEIANIKIEKGSRLYIGQHFKGKYPVKVVFLCDKKNKKSLPTCKLSSLK